MPELVLELTIALFEELVTNVLLLLVLSPLLPQMSAGDIGMLSSVEERGDFLIICSLSIIALADFCTSCSL